MRRRLLLYIALALTVPLPAFALSGGGATPANLAVSVAFDRCALLEAQIVCKLDVSFDSVDGATSYTASVTRPDGSVLDLRTIGASPASIWVGYAGDGVYSVQVSAYGDPEQPDGEPPLLDRGDGEASDPDADEPDGGGEAGGAGDGGETGDAASEEGEATSAGEEQGAEQPAPACAEDRGAERGAVGSGEGTGAEGGGEPDPDTIRPCPR